MTDALPDLGIVGLGRMGGGLARNALGHGARVVGHDPRGVSANLRDAGLVATDDLSALCASLARPRRLFLYVPAGPTVDALLDALVEVLEPGDVVCDGGNSYWGDSRRRAERLAARELYFVDLGTSGGVDGAAHGACFMAGGAPEAYALVRPLLVAMAVEGGVVHAGPPGAGHYTKLVHNGIEFGMLQAIGEGVDLLEHWDAPLPVADVLRCWTRGSVIRSWLVELMEAQYRAHDGLASVPAFVEDTGEVNWLIGDALAREVPIPVIAQSIMQLFTSRDADQRWARAIALMRHGFGGHPLGADADVRRERQTGRVGPIAEAPDDGL